MKPPTVEESEQQEKRAARWRALFTVPRVVAKSVVGFIVMMWGPLLFISVAGSLAFLAQYTSPSESEKKQAAWVVDRFLDMQSKRPGPTNCLMPMVGAEWDCWVKSVERPPVLWVCDRCRCVSEGDEFVPTVTRPDGAHVPVCAP